MTQIRTSLLLVALLAPMSLMACAPRDTTEVVLAEPMPATDPSDTCGASAYQQYVGQKSPAISLPAGTIFRDYRSGSAITMDMAPARINFEYDRSGKLVKVTCG